MDINFLPSEHGNTKNMKCHINRKNKARLIKALVTTGELDGKNESKLFLKSYMNVTSPESKA